MARIRNIKPEFFLNDEIAELEPLTRLFYIGLWTQADREGRMKYRPKRLKAVLMPYDAADVEVMVEGLQASGHVMVYVVDGEHYLQVLNFTRHQSPNIKECASTIPAPCQHSDSTQDRKGKERIGEERNARARDDVPDAKIIEGDTSLPQCLTKPLEVVDPPYTGTCIGFINQACEQQFGTLLSPSEYAELKAAITAGCINDCTGDHPQFCALHIAEKLRTKGKTAFKTSRLWLKCVREDRMEVRQ